MFEAAGGYGRAGPCELSSAWIYVVWKKEECFLSDKIK